MGKLSALILFACCALAEAQSVTPPKNGGTGQDSTGWTGCPTVTAGVWSYSGCPVTKALVSHQFLNSYTSSTGAFTAAQPAFTDISGNLGTAQGPSSLSGLLKDSSGTLSAAVSGTDYQPALGLLAGTYVNGDLCTYASSGTLLNCNTTASGTINNAAQYDVPHYSASGTTNTLSGVPIAGIQFDSTSAAPTAATGNNISAPLLCQYSGSSHTAQSCTTTPTFTPTAYQSCILYKTSAGQTGTSLTINVNSLGAVNVADPSGSTSLAAHLVPANSPLLMCYNGTVWLDYSAASLSQDNGGTALAGTNWNFNGATSLSLPETVSTPTTDSQIAWDLTNYNLAISQQSASYAVVSFPYVNMPFTDLDCLEFATYISNSTPTVADSGSPCGNVTNTNSPSSNTPAWFANSSSIESAPTICTSSASPAACGTTVGNSKAVGFVVIAAGATSVLVKTKLITANSHIQVQEDQSLGTALSVTCDTTSPLTIGPPVISGRTLSGTNEGFTISTVTASVTNPVCLSFLIANQ
jgi:hypothetical protein